MKQEIHNFMIHEKIKHDKTYHNIHRSCWISLLSFKTISTFCKIPCLDNTKPVLLAKFPVISEESPSFLAARWELDCIDWCEFSVQSFFPIFWNLLQLWPKSTKNRGTKEGAVYWPVSNVAWPHYLTSNEYDKQNKCKTLKGGAFRCFTEACLWEEGRCENPTSTQNRRLKALFHLELIRTNEQRYQLPFDLKTISQTYIDEKR